MLDEDVYPYGECRVYGPYQRKDGRLHVVINYPPYGEGSVKQTVSYPKYIIETTLCIKLDEHLVVHHLDGDPLNNDFDNLKIIPRGEHTSQHVSKRNIQTFACPVCASSFILSRLQISRLIAERKKR